MILSTVPGYRAVGLAARLATRTDYLEGTGRRSVGCWWMLMALLFVGGVMNLTWIAALAILVLIEKALPPGQWVGRGAGVALIGWGVATLVV